jgi:hypothetical protein
MYFKLKPARNNKKKFKKEKIDNNNEEKIKHLELENESLKSKINELKEIIKFDLKEIIQIQSNQIVNLKLKLNKYESKSELETYSGQNEDETSQANQSEQTTYYESNILFKKFIFSPDLLIRFDFTGKYDNNSDSSSITKLLMPAVQLSNTEIKLKQMCLENIKSELLFDQLKQSYLQA